MIFRLLGYRYTQTAVMLASLGLYFGLCGPLSLADSSLKTALSTDFLGANHLGKVCEALESENFEFANEQSSYAGLEGTDEKWLLENLAISLLERVESLESDFFAPESIGTGFAQQRPALNCQGLENGRVNKACEKADSKIKGLRAASQASGHIGIKLWENYRHDLKKSVYIYKAMEFLREGGWKKFHAIANANPSSHRLASWKRKASNFVMNPKTVQQEMPEELLQLHSPQSLQILADYPFLSRPVVTKKNFLNELGATFGFVTERLVDKLFALWFWGGDCKSDACRFRKDLEAPLEFILQGVQSQLDSGEIQDGNQANSLEEMMLVRFVKYGLEPLAAIHAKLATKGDVVAVTAIQSSISKWRVDLYGQVNRVLQDPELRELRSFPSLMTHYIQSERSRSKRDRAIVTYCKEGFVDLSAKKIEASGKIVSTAALVGSVILLGVNESSQPKLARYATPLLGLAVAGNSLTHLLRALRLKQELNMHVALFESDRSFVNRQQAGFYGQIAWAGFYGALTSAAPGLMLKKGQVGPGFLIPKFGNDKLSWFTFWLYNATTFGTSFHNYSQEGLNPLVNKRFWFGVMQEYLTSLFIASSELDRAVKAGRLADMVKPILTLTLQSAAATTYISQQAEEISNFFDPSMSDESLLRDFELGYHGSGVSLAWRVGYYLSLVATEKVLFGSALERMFSGNPVLERYIALKRLANWIRLSPLAKEPSRMALQAVLVSIFDYYWSDFYAQAKVSYLTNDSAQVFPFGVWKAYKNVRWLREFVNLGGEQEASSSAEAHQGAFEDIPDAKGDPAEKSREIRHLFDLARLFGLSDSDSFTQGPSAQK